MSVGSVSFWKQSESWRSHMAAASNSYFNSLAGSASTEKLITASSAAASSFASAATNYYYSAAVLAAKAGTQVQHKTAADAAGAKLPADKISDQVSYTGSISGVVDFGADGPSAAGGFQFLTGSALQSAFQSATLLEFSQSEAIDTVSVTGNTLTASTSGASAHDVFTLTLSPNSGTYTFTLLNPVDLSTTESDPVVIFDLSKLMQGVKSTGETVALPSNVTITIDGDQGSSNGTATSGTVHQGQLAFTTPIPAAPASPAAYTPPTNPLTGHGYAPTSAGTQAIGVTLSLFI